MSTYSLLLLKSKNVFEIGCTICRSFTLLWLNRIAPSPRSLLDSVQVSSYSIEHINRCMQDRNI